MKRFITFAILLGLLAGSPAWALDTRGGGSQCTAGGAVANNFVSALSNACAATLAQPSFANLSGSEVCAQTAALIGDTTSPAGSCSTTTVQAHWTTGTLVFAQSPYTVATADTVLLCNATAGAITINLPASIGTGRMLFFKKTDASANACTITRAGADTIDGATTATLVARYDEVTVIDGASGTWNQSDFGVLPAASGGSGTSTIPTSGQLLVGNAGGTAYAPVTLSQDGTISATGVLTVTKTNNVAFNAIATGGITGGGAVANNFLSALSSTGAATLTQPSCANLTGAAASCGTNATELSSGNVASARIATALTTPGAIGGTTSNTVQSTQLCVGTSPCTLPGTTGDINASRSATQGSIQLGTDGNGLSRNLANTGYNFSLDALTIGTNNKGLWEADSAGTRRSVLNFDASNIEQLGGTGVTSIGLNNPTTIGTNAVTNGTLGLANGAGGGNTTTLASGATSAYTLTSPASVFAQGDLLTFSNGTGQMASVVDVAVGRVIVSGGVGAVPTYSATPTLGVGGTTTGTLTLSNATGSGTYTLASAASTTTFTETMPAAVPAQGDLITYSNGTGQRASVVDVAVNSVLVSGGVGAVPTYSSAPTISGANITSIAAGNISSGNLAVARIATALTTPGAIGGTTPSTGQFTGIGNGGAPTATTSEYISFQSATRVGIDMLGNGGTESLCFVSTAGSVSSTCYEATNNTLTIDVGGGAAGKFTQTTTGGTEGGTLSVSGGGVINSTGGTAPTISAGCTAGGGSGLVAGSTNNRGQITTGATAATTCTMTWSAASAWPQAPFCTFTDANASITPVAYSAGACGTSTCVVDFVSAGSKSINYVCM